jgi:intein-encoded DNA endonuclease-like protein
MFDKLILQQQYINDKKSIREIVKETKSHEATVRRNLKEIGICPRKYNEQQIIDNDNGKRINLNKIKPGIEKDPRFFYLLGAFKGDGHYNIKYTKIQFSVTDLDFIEEVKHIFNVLSPETHMRILDGVEATKRTKKQWKINICSRDFFKKEYHKLLPKTLQEKRFYLKGLFDAEGSASEDGGSITICQKNLDDLRLWKEWLEELNIKTKQYISKEEERIYGHLRIFGRDSKINFYDAIGFKIKRKQDRLEQYIKKIKPYVQYDYEEGIDGLDGETDFVEVESICFSNKEQGIDISVDHPDHNVCSSDDIVFMQSTIAQQVWYFLAWLMSGGRMDSD